MRRPRSTNSYTRGVSNDYQARIIGEVLIERDRQDRKHGEPRIDRPDLHVGRIATAALFDEQACKDATDEAARKGEEAWSDVLTEEVAEAYNAPEREALREELIQIAAVAIAWVEHLDRRSAVGL